MRVASQVHLFRNPMNILFQLRTPPIVSRVCLVIVFSVMATISAACPDSPYDADAAGAGPGQTYTESTFQVSSTLCLFVESDSDLPGFTQKQERDCSVCLNQHLAARDNLTDRPDKVPPFLTIRLSLALLPSVCGPRV